MKAEPLTPGRMVRSLAGRDRGRVFVVIDQVDDDFVLIADGALRKLDRPKKKRRKHLRALKERMECMAAGKPTEDHAIVRAIQAAQPHEEG